MDFCFTIIELVLMVILFIVAEVSVRYPSNKWRILYAAPVFLAVALVIFNGFDVYHIGIYLACALQIEGLFMEKVRGKQLLAALSGAILIVSLFVISFIPGYHRIPIYADFEKLYGTLSKHYVLAREKGIDWDEIYSKYEPLFKEADSEQDYIDNYKLWQRLTGEFYDGHVGYSMSSEGLTRDALCRSYGNDYGLSLARLDTGEYVAINVEGYDNSYSIDNTDHDNIGFYSVKDVFKPDSADEDRLTLKNAGIRNGTVITGWNGKPVDEYFDQVNYYMFQYPVRENEEFYLPMYVAGIGKDMEYGQTYVSGDEKAAGAGDTSSNISVDITFINNSGEEETISAPNLGIYAPRLYDTFKKLDDGVNITNLEWQEVDKETYMIRISEMAYDMETYSGTDYTEMTDNLRDKVLALKDAGVKNIIIDLRSNTGGSPYFVEGIAKLFAPKGEHLTYYSAVINEDTATFERGEDGKYEMGVPSSYEGEDLWHDGKIVLLVNAMTVSAGDDMTYMMGDFPNVDVIGFTSTNSSCQAVTSTTGKFGELNFSAVPNLLPNGEVAIDTYTDHVGRTPFDYEIPFNRESIETIFDIGEDYLLRYAAEYMH